MTDFTRQVIAGPSRNWIKPNPSRNYGITNMDLTFMLIGPLGAVQWVIGTKWGCASVRTHVMGFPSRNTEDYLKPTGWDLGYHSPKPMYEDHEPVTETCEYLDGKPCFYDGSGLNADLLIEGFLCGGTNWLWPKLEEVYAHYFEGAEWPDFTATELPHPDDIEAGMAPSHSAPATST